MIDVKKLISTENIAIEGMSIPSLQKIPVREVPTPEILIGQPIPKLQPLQQPVQNNQQQQKPKVSK
jgi:hypothetical protein